VSQGYFSDLVDFSFNVPKLLIFIYNSNISDIKQHILSDTCV